MSYKNIKHSNKKKGGIIINKTNIEEILEDNEKEIHKIFHISDVHIFKYDRHVEFRDVFNNLFQMLKKDAKPYNKSLIVVTGDILDRGMDLSPECVELLQDLYIGLTEICDVVTINGNHDYKGASVNYLNPLYPFIQKAFHPSSGNKSYILSDDKSYVYNNILFGVTTCFTNKVTPCRKKTDKIKIALYHGQFYKSIACNGFQFDDDNLFNCESFEEYDYVLLGDIHKHQYLNKKKTIGYAGSLVQLKRDESTLDHGYIKWEIMKGKSTFVRVPNNKMKLEINYEDGLKLDDLTLSKDLDIKINHKSKVTKEEIEKFIDQIQKKMTGDAQLTYVNRVDYSDSKMKINVDVKGKKISLIQLKNDNDVINLVLEYAKNEGNHDAKMRKKIKILLAKLLKEVDFRYSSKMKSIKLNFLKFNNAFIYGENNHVNFKKFKNIMGINSPNYSGKSSFIDIILFSIFGEHMRGDANRKSALKVGKYELSTEISLNVNNKEYTIKRRYTRKGITSKGGRDTGTYLVEVYCDNVKVRETSKMDEYKKLMNYVTENICTIDDVLRQAIILQKGSEGFVNLRSDARNNARKDYLLKMVNLDLFNRLQDQITKLKNQAAVNKRSANSILSKLTGDIKDKSEKGLKATRALYNEEFARFTDDRGLNLIDIDEAMARYDDINKAYIEDDFLLKKNNYDEHINDKISKSDVNLQQLKNNRTSLEKKLHKICKEYNDMCSTTSDLKETIDKEFNKVTDRNDKFNSRKAKKIQKLKFKIDWLYDNIMHIKTKYNVTELDDKINTIKIKLEDDNDEIYKIEDSITKLNGELVDIIDEQKIKDKFDELSSLQEKLIKADDSAEATSSEISSYNDKLEKLKNHKYNPKCKECMDNTITKEKLYLEGMISDKESHLEMIKKDSKKLTKNISDLIMYKHEFEKLICDLTNNEKIMSKINEGNEKIIKLDNRKQELSNDVTRLYEKRTDCVLAVKTERNNKCIKQYIKLYKLEKDLVSSMKCESYVMFEYKMLRYNSLCEYKNTLEKEIKSIEKDIKVIQSSYDLEISNKNNLLQFEKDNESMIEVKARFDETTIRLNNQMDEINQLRSDGEQYINNIALIKNKIDNINTCIKEKKRIDDDNEVCNNIVNMFKYSDKKEGIIDNIISTNILPYLQNIINEILDSIDGHFTIELKSYNGQINIYTKKNNSGGIDANSSSGYEGDLLNLMFRLAFNKINNYIDMDFLIIDEGLKFSDNKNKEVIKRLIEHMKDSYEWIIMISHDDFIKTFYDQDINIEKISDNESKLIFV